MLKELLSIFTSNPVHRLALVTSICVNIMKTFEQEFAQDHDGKDAAIDTLVALLQAHKGHPVQVTPVDPAKPAA